MHKLLVLERHASAAARLASEGQVLRTIDYGGYKVLFVPDSTMALVANQEMKNRVRVRDDFDLISLNGWVLDTRVGEPAGLSQERRIGPASSAWQLYVVQFVAPVRDEWLAELTRQGDVQVVSYMAHNAYVVRATGAAWSRLSEQAGQSGGELQWAGVYHPAYRISQGLEAAIADGGSPVDLVVQIVDTTEGREAENRIRASAISAISATPVGRSIGGLRNLRIRVPGSTVLGLAREPEIFWIEKQPRVRFMDERQGQICAANLNGSGSEPSGVGYRSWLSGKSLIGTYDFAVDVTDSGLSPSQDDFKTQGTGNSRITYGENYQDCSQDIVDTSGHGTLVASIVGGDPEDASANKDGSNYLYGQGIAPSVNIGVSKIGLALDSEECDALDFDALMENAWANAARIVNNSWADGESGFGDYTTLSQEYDGYVRDANSGVGHQQMTIIFAAGNEGQSGLNAPATAKNVITVGGTENWRTSAPGTCSLTSSEGNDARDMFADSSRGPTDDSRKKPEIVAPATHVTGLLSSEVADPEYTCEPTGYYALATGTSLAAPAVSGAAALVRKRFLNNSWGGPVDSGPSPAMIKAFLIATATHVTGSGANDTLPSNNQGYGRLNLGRAFDTAANTRYDQVTNDILGSSGATFVREGEVADSGKPFRVVLVWTDAPGPTSGNAYVNDLDLEVRPLGQGIVYQGNQFDGANSKCGCEVCPDPPCVDVVYDTRNNTEAVFLPAGTVTDYEITVRAITIGGNGVPGNFDDTDQDFALFVYNGTP